MLLVNTDYITGKELEMLGIVKGSTIQTRNLGRDITQGFKSLVGGELKAYTEMMNEARALATSAWSKKRKRAAPTRESAPRSLRFVNSGRTEHL